MNYGYFDDAHREYIITNPKTPVKWINYIGTLEFGGYVDQTGGTQLCKGDPALNRITKYIPQLPASDFKGETLYLRKHTTAGYELLAPFFTPCLSSYERYECHVGLGYTRIVSQISGIETDTVIFVPQGAACEVRWVQVTNRSASAVEVDAIPLVEYTHFDALKQLTNADWVPQTMQSKAVHQADGQVILLQYAFMKRDTAVNYFTANLPASSFETDRRLFLGDNEYGTFARPLSLLTAELPNSEATRGDNIGALLLPLGTLQPGEMKEFTVLLGQEASLKEALPIIERFCQPHNAAAALDEQSRYWDAYLGKQVVHTPDAAFNSMLNIHNPHQCYITKTWSRYLSLYQLGYGASRGIGFRDSSQDVMGVLAGAPEEAKALICKLLMVQKRSGCAMHQFNPLTMEGNEGDSLEREDRPHFYSDDHLWIVQAVCAYLKETGDLAFLNESIPFYDKDKTGMALESASVLEHLLHAVEFTHGSRGAHGLPLLGFADWNDTLNLASGAESVLSACLYGQALGELIRLAEVQGNSQLTTHLQGYYAEMKQIVNSQAWDGEWYVSYFDADGTPLGSHHNAAGQIYAYGQAWPVICSFASPERSRQALDSLNRLLNTRNGIKLSTPGFNGFDPTKGGITTYPPGAKENGGIFLHVNPWVIIAETLAGSGERAYQYYAQINPAARNDRLDEFQCEPYVYPQNILADEHPLFGLGRNAWLSGTASWMFQAGAQFILGIQPDYAGLRIQPCIPSSWDGFSVERSFRGAVYAITISNPEHVSRGVRSLRVDGILIADGVVSIFADGKTHVVEVILG